MARTIYVSLPVSDVARSTAFYEALGFVKDPRLSSEAGSAMQWSDAIVIMVVARDVFATLTTKTVADPATTTTSLLALSMESRAAVDALVEAAAAAGGIADIRPVRDMGGMYSRAFADPDGHGFGPFQMDAAAA